MNLRWLVVILAGGLFGAGLALSGMTDPARVIGFLDATGNCDPTLVAVMAAAVTTYAVTMAVQAKLAGSRGWFGATLPTRKSKPVTARLVYGSLVFGVGWGLVGLCPGPAIANLGALHLQSLLFVPAMIMGMLAARTYFGADRE